eukprot:gene16947-18654_t
MTDRRSRKARDAPDDLSAGYFSSSTDLSRSNSTHNITKMSTDDPATLLMQKRIDELEIAFKQLDKIADDIDYDIETLEGYTGKVRNGFHDIQEDMDVVRDEVLNLFDHLNAIEDDMKTRAKKKRFGLDAKNTGVLSGLDTSYMNSNRRTYLGSKQSLNRSSQSDLRGSSYSLDRYESTYEPVPARQAVTKPRKAELSPEISPYNSPDYSPANSRPHSPSPVESPQHSPAQSPVQSPLQSPRQSPAQSPVQSPVQSPMQSPMHSRSQSPVQSPLQSPERSPIQSPVQSPMQSPVYSPEQSPLQSPVYSPKQSPMQSPAYSPEQSPMQSPMYSPEQSPMQSPAQSPPLSPARSKEDINANYDVGEVISDVGSDY